jgi:peptidoglycan/LPS O-acetylase OafA/YrhL
VARRVHLPWSAGRRDDPAAIRHRETDPLKVVPALDGARGFAIILVILYHCWIAAQNARLDDGLARDLLASGYVAIDMFFVISGFVLFLPTARDRTFGSVRDYAMRRVARVAPAYYVALAGLVLVYPAIATPGTPGFWHRDQVESLGVHALFLQRELLGAVHGMYGFGTTIGMGVNEPLWSLSIEALFYIALPIVAMAYLRRPLVGLVIAFGLQTVWRIGAWHVTPHFLAPDTAPDRRASVVVGMAFQFPAFLGTLALGMTAAWIYVRVLRSPEGSRLQRLRWRAGPLQLVALAGLIAVMAVGGHRDNTYQYGGVYFEHFRDQLPAVLFALVLLLAALSGRRGQLAWSNPVIRWVGDISYGTYLWHALVIWFALWQLGWYPYSADVQGQLWPFFRNALFVLPIALLFGWASFRYVEQPVIRWMRDRLRRKRVAAAAAAAAAEPAGVPTA